MDALDATQVALVSDLFGASSNGAAECLAEVLGAAVVRGDPVVKVGPVDRIVAATTDVMASSPDQVLLRFGGTVRGVAGLFLTRSCADAMSRTCMGELAADVTERIGFIKELGNLTLNATMGGFSNHVGIDLKYEPLAYSHLSAANTMFMGVRQVLWIHCKLEMPTLQHRVGLVVSCFEPRVLLLYLRHLGLKTLEVRRAG